MGGAGLFPERHLEAGACLQADFAEKKSRGAVAEPSWDWRALFVANYDRPPMMSIGLYVLLVFLVPYAKTSEERAAAQGLSASLPYKMQNVVEKVKAKFDGLHHKMH